MLVKHDNSKKDKRPKRSLKRYENRQFAYYQQMLEMETNIDTSVKKNMRIGCYILYIKAILKVDQSI